MMMTETQLLNFCKQSLRALGSRGTDLEIKQVKKQVLGLTVYRKGERPLILINPCLAKEADIVINSIVVHEYAHVIAGQAAGHNSKWKAIANKFAAQLHTYKITEHVEDTIQLSMDFWLKTFDHVYTCTKCGKTIGFDTSSNIVISRSTTHIHCGGHWKKIK